MHLQQVDNVGLAYRAVLCIHLVSHITYAGQVGALSLRISVLIDFHLDFRDII
jgi:hypothetical protein